MLPYVNYSLLTRDLLPAVAHPETGPPAPLTRDLLPAVAHPETGPPAPLTGDLLPAVAHPRPPGGGLCKRVQKSR